MAKRSTPQKRQQQSTVKIEKREFSGPLPPPEVLAQFNQIEPGFADRIVQMAEKQSQHRIRVEGWFSAAEVFARGFGVIAALITVLAMCSVAAYAFHLGHAEWAAGVMGTTMLGLVYAFLKRPKPEPG